MAVWLWKVARLFVCFYSLCYTAIRSLSLPQGHLIFHNAKMCKLYTHCVFLRPSDSQEGASSLMRRRWRRDYAPQAQNKQHRQQQPGSDADCHVPSSPLLVAYERFWRELIWPEHLRCGCSYPEVRFATRTFPVRPA
jgi:hypothetical protein